MCWRSLRRNCDRRRSRPGSFLVSHHHGRCSSNKWILVRGPLPAARSLRTARTADRGLRL
jgi:hypothetical protein